MTTLDLNYKKMPFVFNRWKISLRISHREDVFVILGYNTVSNDLG